MFRPERVRPFLGSLEKIVQRQALDCESVHFLPQKDSIAYPGKSCRDRRTRHEIVNRIGKLCAKFPNDQVVLALWIGGNGVFGRKRVAAAAEVQQELDAHCCLTAELLRKNSNLVILVLGVLPRLAVCELQECKEFLDDVNRRLKAGVESIAIWPKRAVFHSMAPFFFKNPNLFHTDLVHLTSRGTQEVLSRISSLLDSDIPLLKHRV